MSRKLRAFDWDVESDGGLEVDAVMDEIMDVAVRRFGCEVS